MIPAFDWRNPDYAPVWAERQRRLLWIRADKTGQRLAHLKLWYRDNPADFINDWGCTFDPRAADLGLPTTMPFLLFPKQREAVDYVMRKWKARETGIVEKSREVGMSWVTVSLACTLALFTPGIVVGFGSRKEEYVDRGASPKSLFYKARMFLRMLPPEFLGDYVEKRDAPHMRITIPHTGSALVGEAGDGIGRGDRASIYFVDEAAFLERPALVDASLSQTTNCRIDVSSANGMGNPFAQKVHGGKIEVFRLHWRDDPRKDEVWYAREVDKIDNPVIVAQELDIDYGASAEGVLIPSDWVQAAIGAHLKLGLDVTGDRRGALDIGDTGDKTAFCVAHGILVESVEAWSGEASDTFASVQRAFRLCDDNGIRLFYYDADGMGALVRGDARVINEQRTRELAIEVLPFRGSGAVFEPDKPIPTAVASKAGRDRNERLNKDYFLNAKAQAWWSLRLRFQRTWRAVKAGSIEGYDPDDLISLDPDMPELQAVTRELSQPTYDENGAGKLFVDKAPDGTRSPNHADAVMIRFAPRSRGSFLTAYAGR